MLVKLNYILFIKVLIKLSRRQDMKKCVARTWFKFIINLIAMLCINFIMRWRVVKIMLFHSSSSFSAISVKVNKSVLRSSEIFWLPLAISYSSFSCPILAFSLSAFSSLSILRILRFCSSTSSSSSAHSSSMF